jgi:uncharacterized protein (DUF169 family)
MSPCKVEDYAEISKTLKNKLNLTNSPVAVKLFLSEEDAKSVLNKTDEKSRHCEMIQKASQGESFYATIEEESCKGGAAAIGLRDFPEELITGEKYFSSKKYSSMGTSAHALRQVSKVDTMMEAIGYMPLEDATFAVDVVVIKCKPVDAMLLVQAEGYVLGKRFNADFSGIQSVCSDVVASPYMNKEPNITFGCNGSRRLADIKPDEVIIGLPVENLGCIINSINNITE